MSAHLTAKRTKLLCPSWLLRGARLYKPMHAHCGALAHAHTYCCSAEGRHCCWQCVGTAHYNMTHTHYQHMCLQWGERHS